MPKAPPHPLEEIVAMREGRPYAIKSIPYYSHRLPAYNPHRPFLTIL